MIATVNIRFPREMVTSLPPYDCKARKRDMDDVRNFISQIFINEPAMCKKLVMLFRKQREGILFPLQEYDFRFKVY